MQIIKDTALRLGCTELGVFQNVYYRRDDWEKKAMKEYEGYLKGNPVAKTVIDFCLNVLARRSPQP
jgi:hypothetical protein